MKTITPTVPQLRMLASISGKRWMMLESEVPHFALAALDVPEKASALNIEIEDFYELRPPMSIDGDGLATIHIHGALMDSCPAIYEKLGLVTCYGTITGEIDAALEAGARGIMFAVNSPGGTVMGCAEAAEYMSGLGVPTVSACKGLACSAAYKLAAGTDSIIATGSAIVGNVGTILSWTDCTEFWRANGIEFKALTSQGADLKSTFHLEPNPEQVAFLQESLNEDGAKFRAHVEAGRAAAGAAIDPEVWRAGWYSGETAGRLGLIDGIGDASAAKEVLAGMIDTTGRA
jgi:ClpP class serine protease